jgi:hypothetical protein
MEEHRKTYRVTLLSPKGKPVDKLYCQQPNMAAARRYVDRWMRGLIDGNIYPYGWTVEEVKADERV